MPILFCIARQHKVLIRKGIAGVRKATRVAVGVIAIHPAVVGSSAAGRDGEELHISSAGAMVVVVVVERLVELMLAAELVESHRAPPKVFLKRRRGPTAFSSPIAPIAILAIDQ